MDKKTIVRKCLESGTLLSPEALGALHSDSTGDLLKKVVESGRIFISSPDAVLGTGPDQEKGGDTVEKTEHKEEKKPVHTNTSVVFDSPEKRERLTPKDFAGFYTAKYSAIRNMLIKKMPNAVSINKVSGLYSNVDIIGMVASQSHGRFVLEDPTGTIEVVHNDSILPDTVIGVSGFIKEGKLFPKKIVLPDIPLNRTIQTIDNESLLLSPKKTSSESGLVLVPDNLAENPARGAVKNGSSAINILVYKPDKKADVKKAVEWLKYRCIPHPDIPNPTNSYVIEPVPDIFWVVSGDRGFELYKGVTVICTNKTPAKIDLGSLQVTFEE